MEGKPTGATNAPAVRVDLPMTQEAKQNSYVTSDGSRALQNTNGAPHKVESVRAWFVGRCAQAVPAVVPRGGDGGRIRAPVTEAQIDVMRCGRNRDTSRRQRQLAEHMPPWALWWDVANCA